MLLRVIFYSVCVIAGVFEINAQDKKHMDVDPIPGTTFVRLNVTSVEAVSYLKPSQNSKPLNLYFISEDENSLPRLESKVLGPMHDVSVMVEKPRMANSGLLGLGIFGAEDYKEKCNLYLGRDHAYELDLKYGTGNAYLDLSGIPIRKMSITSGSADVFVNCNRNMPNPSELDTFNIKSDLGKIYIKNLNELKAKVVKANISFGSVELELNDQLLNNTHVQASLGAGSLNVICNNQSIPVKVVIQDSPLCKIKLNEKFIQVSKNTFVNQAFLDRVSPNQYYIRFDLAVAMGNISFK
ncbi:hypothetical protein [Marinigracilibium pacificum]|uniref:Adhesin domain-containing protein n=1 Tax=Marinigracilibium pacificum TaxID=2729599 RepID=A0A848IYJ2_9BACT|nr:hypothetical protein [Marinigracilibium pacificum]NMM48706.1 hypothetical protein [Marinigracilibium pacificum]